MSKPQLNSLDRFRKQPGNLVLEQYSHCEVPAGCGGVVLRWRNPRVARSVILHLYTPKEATCLLDGQPVTSARVDLAPGPHVLAVALEDVDLTQGLVMFAAHDGAARRGLDDTPLVASAEDSTWKASRVRPADDWTTLAFDDSDWQVLTRVPTPQLDWRDFGAAQLHQCERAGAHCLGLADVKRASGIWVRKVFTITTEEG